jgi:hypothetical protein
MDDEWEVRKIKGERMTESGREFKVAWKTTWIPETGLSNAKRAIASYRRRVQRDNVGLPQMHSSAEVKVGARKGRDDGEFLRTCLLSDSGGSCFLFVST